MADVEEAAAKAHVDPQALEQARADLGIIASRANAGGVQAAVQWGIAGMMKSMMRWIARRLQRTDKDAAKDEFRPNDHCDGCGAGFDAEPRAPVLIDTTWAKLAEKHETLCAPCLLNRSIERRVLLTVADLVPCEFNRWGSPSWFDLFSQLK